jgi:autotransporter-associated beta strand protein
VTVTGTHTLSAPLAGSSALLKQGPGALVLSGNNSAYAGAATVAAGTLQVAQANALPTAGVTVSSSATLALNVGGTGEFSNATTGPGSLGAALGLSAFTAGSTLGLDTTHGGTVTYSGAITGPMALNKLGPGALILNNASTSYAGGTTVSGGTLEVGKVTTSLSIASGATAVLLDSGGHNLNASVLPASSFADLGTLDLTDNGLVITGATSTFEAGIKTLITNGGITSSIVAANGAKMTLAYDMASDISGLSTWGGYSITDPSSTLLILPTAVGDLDMNGTVNGQDLLTLLSHYGRTSASWAQGDVDFNGTVNGQDLLALLSHYGVTVATLSPNSLLTGGSSSGLSSGTTGLTAAPEPASLVLLGLGGLCLIRRRNRKA